MFHTFRYRRKWSQREIQVPLLMCVKGHSQAPASMAPQVGARPLLARVS